MHKFGIAVAMAGFWVSIVASLFANSAQPARHWVRVAGAVVMVIGGGMVAIAWFTDG
jgi:hypothetical protein